MSCIARVRVSFFITLIFGLFILLIPNVILAASPDSTDNKLVELVNLERQKAHLSSLRYSEKLFQVASKHNSAMSTCTVLGGRNCFSHQVSSQGEPDLMARFMQSGYHAQSAGEIIGWGYTTPQAQIVGWMKSSGHRANILNNSRTELGCDYLNKAGKWYTCAFGKSF